VEIALDENITQAYARLTCHEFMLEILYANFLADMSATDAQSFASKILSRSQSAWMAPDVDKDFAENNGLKVVQDSHAMTSRFLEKALARSTEIRAERLRS
jgi:hypothetical protein